MSRRFPTRFTTGQVGGVYASEEPETAAEELRRRAALVSVPLTAFTPRSMYVLELMADRVLDLVDPKIRGAWGLTAHDLGGDDYRRCQEASVAASASGFEVTHWPSAAGAGVSVVVLLDRLRPESSLRLTAEYPLDLAELERGMPLLELVPGLRRW